MQIRLVKSAAAALVLVALAGQASATGPDNSRNFKRSTVETFRNDKATPASRGRSLVASFTRTTASAVGGVGKSTVRGVKRKDGPPSTHGKSLVVKVTRVGSNPDSSVASIDGDRDRRKK